MDLQSSREPTWPLTPFPGKQESSLTWPRPPARQKFLFSAKLGHSCQLGHQSIRQVPGRGEAVACPCHRTPVVPGDWAHSGQGAVMVLLGTGPAGTRLAGSARGGEATATAQPWPPLSVLCAGTPPAWEAAVCFLCPRPLGSSEAWQAQALAFLQPHPSLAASYIVFTNDNY